MKDLLINLMNRSFLLLYILYLGNVVYILMCLFFFFFLYFFLFTSLLFTFGLNESIGISLCTGKIHCLPGAREKAESRVTNRSEGMFVSASLFLGARDSVAIH